MSQGRFVTPEVVRLALSDNDVVTIKKQLNAGEYYDLIVAMSDRKSFAKLLAYIINWSLTSDDGQPIPYSLEMDEQQRRDTVRGLTVATMRELVDAIDKHEAAEERAHEEKKRTRALSLVSSPTSAFVAP